MSNIKNLEDIVKNNAKEYYTTGRQKLSDDVFDAVVEKIREENSESDVISTAWGYKPEENNKFKHKYCHIGSLDKIKTYESIHKKLNVCDLNVSAKLDGMSVVLYYENGNLIQALTRGDGEYGIDITNKVINILGCSEKIEASNFTGAIRGEILMTPKTFEQFKLIHPEAKNHRNSAIGIINSDESTEYEYLRLYVYTVIKFDNIDTGTYDLRNLNNFLQQHFLFVVPNVYLDHKNFNDNNYYEILKKYSDEYKKEVFIDGVVLTDTKIKFDKETFQYNQYAFKFQDEIKISTVIGIEWTLSKNSAYIPVICIEPLELEGTTVKRVTGYNAKYIKDNGIKTGSIVAVCKANQIIPKIVEVIK